MKVIIAGGRHFDNYKILKNFCDHILQHIDEPIEVVSGCAYGADRLGERYAREMGYDIKYFPAPWDDVEGKLGSQVGRSRDGRPYWKGAGHFRNSQMADYADGLIAFWDANSTGTKDMINRMENMGKRVSVRLVDYKTNKKKPVKRKGILKRSSENGI